MKNFIEELKWRGMLAQIMPGAEELLQKAREEREEAELQEMQKRLRRKRSIHNPIRRSLSNFPSPSDLLERLRPDDLNLNYINLIDRAMSIGIKQNAALNLLIYQPDILADIPMTQFGGFDYDKGEEIAAIGQAAMRKAIKRMKKDLND